MLDREPTLIGSNSQRKDRGDQDQQKDRRNGQQHIDEPHEHLVDETAEKSRCQADAPANGDVQRNSKEPHAE